MIHATHKVPYALRKSPVEVLKDRAANCIIRTREEPADGVHSPMTAEKKGGGPRSRIDPKELNKNIKKEHLHIPTRGVLLSEMAEASEEDMSEIRTETPVETSLQVDPEREPVAEHLSADKNIDKEGKLYSRAGRWLKWPKRLI